ncbi:MAG TPA: rhodanese-like domain-containing protein [Pyrinomonadaceae bacterium]|jgi:UPF0176 protein|nr:rhodanese-like domain-containing protein [Pyrinomonadaceae bacterium]
MIEIISFYEFKDLPAIAPLDEIKLALKTAMQEHDIHGTIIIADEGYNGMVCGTEPAVAEFAQAIAAVLKTELDTKSSLHEAEPFRRREVKIKPEIVTLKKPVDISLGSGTHVKPADWNEVISDPETVVLDARNDYEHETGTFKGAVNPGTAKFSDLPAFVAQNLDPERHKRVAMFCTGGIRCEKFAPYLKQLGFDEVYQLEGGILKYLEDVPADKSLWEGECFVFDERVSVDHSLAKGSAEDLSHRLSSRKKTKYKVAK